RYSVPFYRLNKVTAHNTLRKKSAGYLCEIEHLGVQLEKIHLIPISLNKFQLRGKPQKQEIRSKNPLSD
ncbi:hypothetical protein EJO82_20580, partial [Salmonella enterica]|nr:hypothetical protein [Salmonella enterica]